MSLDARLHGDQEAPQLPRRGTWEERKPPVTPRLAKQVVLNAGGGGRGGEETSHAWAPFPSDVDDLGTQDSDSGKKKRPPAPCSFALCAGAMRAVAAAVFVGVAAVEADASYRARTLVVLDDPSVPHTHSIFFKSLQARGHTLTFLSARDKGLRLGRYGLYDYENAVIFAPQTEEFGGDFDAAHVADFVAAGGNLLLISGAGASETNREIANDAGVDLAPGSARVADSVAFNSAPLARTSDPETFTPASETVLAASDSAIIGDIGPAPVIFSGASQTSNPSNPLIRSLLFASNTAYSGESGSPSAGSPSPEPIQLASAVQSHKNARVAVVGSGFLFSNRAFNAPVMDPRTQQTYPRSANEAFSAEISKWVFKEKGVLRAFNFTHKRVGGPALEDPSIYRIGDEIDVGVTIEELGPDGWQAFRADDVQLEFVMMDPFIRVAMQPGANGRFSTRIRAPDVFGIYKFRMIYARSQYTTVKITEQVSVRPYRHDEHKRFIPNAYPYYASAFSSMAGFLIFCVYFLYGKSADTEPKADAKTDGKADGKMGGGN